MKKKLGKLSTQIYRFLRRKLKIVKRIWTAYKWWLRQKNDYKFASKRWGYRNFPLDLPTIPLRETYKLRTEIEPHFYHYNPSILFKSNKLYICWRVSNYKGSPNVNWAKENSLSAPRFDPKTFRNAIALGEITDFDISARPDIENQRLANELAEFARTPESKASKVDALYVSTLIDPKFLGDDIGLILGNFESWKESPDGKYSVNPSMGVLDLNEKSQCVLIPYQESYSEKNWSYVQSTEDTFKFLRSSSPHVVLSVQKCLPYNVMDVEIESNVERFANGGSNFVLVDDAYFLRIARYRFSSKGRFNCHINIVIKHDRNLFEISRSKPFIFQIFGYEICNGFQLHGEEFVFSWGENDESMFLGSIEKRIFLDWLEQMWEI
jgi:hypothetical protein